MAELLRNFTENFILPEFKQEPVPEQIENILKPYNITQREVYDVINDFDEPADKLTLIQKELRKKYLVIILQFMDKYKDDLKKMLKEQLYKDDVNDEFSKYGLGNIDPTFDTIKRIINLLIIEIDLASETKNASCNIPCNKPSCNKTPYIAVIAILSIILVIMISIFILRVNK
jgi:hypothetical protein